MPTPTPTPRPRLTYDEAIRAQCTNPHHWRYMGACVECDDPDIPNDPETDRILARAQARQSKRARA